MCLPHFVQMIFVWHILGFSSCLFTSDLWINIILTLMRPFYTFCIQFNGYSFQHIRLYPYSSHICLQTSLWHSCLLPTEHFLWTIFLYERSLAIFTISYSYNMIQYNCFCFKRVWIAEILVHLRVFLSGILFCQVMFKIYWKHQLCYKIIFWTRVWKVLTFSIKLNFLTGCEVWKP